MNKPDVSIIIPVYNGMPFLPETITSIRNQTLKNIQIIAIDDGSTDESLPYLQSIRDDRLYIVQQERGGLCETLNHGIQLSKASFIARNDQDDVSINSRLEEQLNYFKRYPDYGCVFTGIVKFSSAKDIDMSDKGLMRKNELFYDFDPWIDGNQLNSTMMVKKELLVSLGGYRKDFYPADDWDLELRMFEVSPIAILNRPLVRYRYHNNANTLKYHFVMQEHRRWAEDCHLNRVKGLPEKSYANYKKIADAEIFKRLNRYRKDVSKLLIRLAGTKILENKWIIGSGYIMLFFLFTPIKFFKRCFWFLINKLSANKLFLSQYK